MAESMMYAEFYGFTKEPFQANSDLEFFFLSLNLDDILTTTEYYIRWRKGFITITAEAGMGKTMLLAYHRKMVGDDKLVGNKRKTIYLTNPRVGFDPLLGTILKELGAEPALGETTTEKINQLQALLLTEYHNNRYVVLVIDDAECLPIETLESFHLLSNLEASNHKLMQLLLVGGPELDALLDRQELHHIRDLIALRARIPPLTKLESLAYIQHRLKIASRRPETVFAKRALHLLTKAANGIPRKLNTLCEAALTTGFGYQQPVISHKIAREVIADLNGHRAPLPWRIQPRRRGHDQHCFANHLLLDDITAVYGAEGQSCKTVNCGGISIAIDRNRGSSTIVSD